MYNRYVGNTGKFVRVEDSPRQPTAGFRTGPGGNAGPDIRGPAAVQSAHGPAPVHQPPPIHEPPPPNPAGPVRRPKPRSYSLLGGVGDGLKSLLGGFGGSGGLGGLGGLGSLGGNASGALKGMFEHLPFGLEIGDLLLLAMLFFFFVESGDEEFIIILAFFVFSIYKDSKAA